MRLEVDSAKQAARAACRRFAPENHPLKDKLRAARRLDPDQKNYLRNSSENDTKLQLDTVTENTNKLREDMERIFEVMAGRFDRLRSPSLAFRHLASPSLAFALRSPPAASTD